ncbi:MAG: choice-of-anchor D domain-containing protein [Bryobacteraceae bacterium]|jgi:hypothetical protein
MKLTPIILFLAATAAASAQSQGPAAITVGTVHFEGLPRDWSHRHTLFSNPGTEAEALKAGTHDRWLKIVNDPRYVLQQLQRQQPGQGPAAAQVTNLLATPHIAPGAAPDKTKKHRDWSMNLGAGNLLPNTYPAKWSFDTTMANCSTDFVIFATGASGSSSQATIVAYNNLYSGCGGTVPSVYWEYNTASNGVNSLSPILSADGSQVAFIQASVGVSSLVVLKWAANTSLLSLSATAAASYRNCTAPCMAVLPFAGGSLDGYAAPYYDYANDIAYVGDNNGALHKFTGVFNGTPAETTMSPWPVALAGTLSSPVLDSVSGRIMVGSQNGILYAVNSSTGAVVGTSSQLGFDANAIYDAPLVDSSAAMVYAFVGFDGDSNSTCNENSANQFSHNGCSGVFQFPVGFTSGAGTESQVGYGGGNSGSPLFSGAFNNDYYNSSSSSPSGALYVCGTATTANTQTFNQVGISSNVMGPVAFSGESTVNFGQQGFFQTFLVGYQAPCSPVTEFYNSTSGIDHLFVSSQVSTCEGASLTGCWYDFQTGITAEAVFGLANGGTSGIIVDNMVGSGTLAGASQLYFTTLGNSGTCATSGGTGICGVQNAQTATSPTTCGGVCDIPSSNRGSSNLPECGCPVQEPAGCSQQTSPCSNYYTYMVGDSEDCAGGCNLNCTPTNAADPSTYIGYRTLAGTYSSCFDNACVETGSCVSACYPANEVTVSSTANCLLGSRFISLYNSLGDLVLTTYCSQITANLGYPNPPTALYGGDLFHNCWDTDYGGPWINNLPNLPDLILAATVVDVRAGTNHAQLFFGNQPVNTSATKTFTLNNRGATAISLTGMTVSGPNAAQFTLSPGSNCGSSLAARTRCTISVTFTPAAKVSYSATLNVTGSGSLGTRTAALSGAGQ